VGSTVVLSLQPQGQKLKANGANPLLVTLGSERVLLPALVVVAVLCLVGGPLLFLSPSIRRRQRSAAGPPAHRWWTRTRPDEDG
jgi:hypothetical protein